MPFISEVVSIRDNHGSDAACAYVVTGNAAVAESQVGRS